MSCIVHALDNSKIANLLSEQRLKTIPKGTPNDDMEDSCLQYIQNIHPCIIKCRNKSRRNEDKTKELITKHWTQTSGTCKKKISK